MIRRHIESGRENYVLPPKMVPRMPHVARLPPRRLSADAAFTLHVAARYGFYAAAARYRHAR